LLLNLKIPAQSGQSGFAHVGLGLFYAGKSVGSQSSILSAGQYSVG